MNKKFLTMAAFAAMCVFATTSCSNDDDIIGGDNGVENVEGVTAGEVVLAVDGGGEGLNTRAIGRPVTSSAAANSVDEVQLELYKKEGTTYTKVTTASFVDHNTKLADGKIAWTNETPVEGVPGYEDDNRDTKKAIKINNLDKEAAAYRLVAYGYQKEHNPYSASATWDGTNAWYTSPTVANDEDVVEEIFGGYVDFETDADGKITDLNVSVTLKRQVAGLLGYFKNIPIKKLNDEGKECVVKKIEVRANATTTQLKFPVDNTNNSNRLNGESQKVESTVLLDYDLTEYSEQVADAEVGDTYKIDAKTGDVATVANSVLAGRFVIPYESAVTGETNTLTVALVGDEGDIRTWKIKIAGQNDGSYSGDEYNYNILRNNFYSIGKKLKSDTTDPDPENPGDEDDPIDLSQDNDVIIILNDAWDIIYNMGLGD